MMRRDLLDEYKESIDTPEEMVMVLKRIRDNLLKHYCIYYGWSLEDSCSLLEMVLKLNKEIRHYEWVIGEKERLSTAY